MQQLIELVQTKVTKKQKPLAFQVQLQLVAPESAKKPARRELWSDAESLQLIQLSVQGSSR